ncbi:MAG: hypothetical protein O9282_08510 [Flavobacterium sp.]|jgi:hypothetical protein|uniref:hypothetical protein n=1 Tax=Flavobacterium sp. TaxID=239 RepID=UPI0022BD754B|nr:hypothetical protein [Flavobacterium sp.]MCZ8331339.1 hypothetical protein [Flavobacterium sp.]
MTIDQYNTLENLISGNVNNTNLLGQDLKKQYDKSVNIEKNIKLMMENQILLFNQ